MALRAGLLSVPSKARGRLPHLTAADAEEIEAIIRDVLTDVPKEAGLPEEVWISAENDDAVEPGGD